MKNSIFILMDDSGKLHANENSCIYGGLFFFSNKDYVNFINKYKSIINSIKCKYCKQNKNSCNKNCPEIKGTTRISPSDNRRIFNLVKKEKNYGVFINNKKIYNSIINNKAARGRYNDYAQKRIIKEVVLYGIKTNKLNINKPIYINIKIDECSSKSNGYYNLKDSIYEELVHGIINYVYSSYYEPIIKNKLTLKLGKYNSAKNYGIQSADIMSHYLHKEYELFLTIQKDISSAISFIEVTLFLP